MIERYDFVVIGSGPAGEKAAIQAASFGKRVALVERAALGGVAVTRAGMIPTKTLRETALYVTGFRKRDVYGVNIGLDARSAHAKLGERTDQVLTEMTRLVRRGIVRHRIELVRGNARLRADHSVVVDDDRELAADTILIATGSHPYHPPGVPFDDPDVLDSEDILDLDAPPAAMVIVGGGAIACEHTSIFTALGTKVALVDPGERLLPYADHELAMMLARTFEQMGIAVHLGSSVDAIARDEGMLSASIDGRVTHPDKVLYAFGRSGNTGGLGLAELGIEIDRRGCIVVDENYRTAVPGIYAAGDVIGPPALASVSAEQGRAVAYHAFATPLRTRPEQTAPIGVFSIPEVAGVGMTELAARDAGVDYEIGRGRFETNPRAAISGATEGLVKLIFRRKDRELLGAHILGEAATELIHIGQLAVARSEPIDLFADATFNVPTAAEAYKEAAYDGLQRLGAG